MFHAYAQGTSLNQISDYGVGQGTPRTETTFGMTETIVGGDVIWPLLSKWNIALLAEANGRFYSIRENSRLGFSAPSYAQFGEGIRLRPSFVTGYVRLNYVAAFQEWIASTGNFSFRRLKLDLDHQFPIYKNTRSLLPHDFNGPDSCGVSPTDRNCPSITRNLEGSFGLRFFYTRSYTSGASSRAVLP